MELSELLNGAESLARIDTNAAIYRCRQFAEALTAALADELGVDISETPFVEQINAVSSKAGLSPRTSRALHNLRILGNKAVHHHLSGDEEVRSALGLCEEILAGTREILPAGVLVDRNSDLPVVAGEPEREDAPGPLLDAIKTLRDQACRHLAAGLDVPAVASFERIDPDVLMQLSTSGIPREVLEQEGLIACRVAGDPLDLNKIGPLGDLGLRLAGLDASTVKLLVPPTSRPAADLGLNPLGDAYVDGLCRASYLEGRLSRRDVGKHLVAALHRAREARSLHPEWPDAIPYADLRSATLASFQWPDSQRQFFAGRKCVTKTEWKGISSQAGWYNDKLVAKIVS